MSKSEDNNISQVVSPVGNGKQILELIVVMLVTVLPIILVQEIKGLMMLLPVSYLLIDKQLRNRTWDEFGIKCAGYLKGMKTNWHLIFLVVFILQPIVIVGTTLYMPSFMEHIYSRIP